MTLFYGIYQERMITLLNWLHNNKIFSLLVLIFLLILFFQLFSGYKTNEEQNISYEGNYSNDISNNNAQTTTEEIVQEGNDSLILVDIKGAVMRPGVYEAREGERVTDILDKAGGVTEEGDIDAINLALKLTDEMIIYVPKEGEVEEGNLASGQADVTGSSQEQLVNINTATEVELETLPGIGPSKAAAIIEYRETNGKFTTIEDMKEISGIGDKIFEKLKDTISVK